MQTLKPTDISETGVKLVNEWLCENGFVNVLNTSVNEGSISITSDGNIENILVIVRTHVDPFRPVRISERERDQIKTTSKSMGRRGYVAYVVIDADKHIVGEISWERLS